MTFIPDDSAAIDPVTVTGDGFYPDLSVADFRDWARVDDSVTDGRARASLLVAISRTYRTLTGWTAAQQAAGHQTLAAVPGPDVDGQPAAVLDYREAIYCQAKAMLLDAYRDVDLSVAGEVRSNPSIVATEEYRRRAHEALARLTGRARATVDLI